MYEKKASGYPLERWERVKTTEKQRGTHRELRNGVASIRPSQSLPLSFLVFWSLWVLKWSKNPVGFKNGWFTEIIACFWLEIHSMAIGGLISNRNFGSFIGSGMVACSTLFYIFFIFYFVSVFLFLVAFVNSCLFAVELVHACIWIRLFYFLNFPILWGELFNLVACCFFRLTFCVDNLDMLIDFQ